MPRTTERRSAIAALGRGPGLGDGTTRRHRIGLEELLGHAQAHRDGDQPGLRPVVQVALQPAQLGRRVVHGRGPALGERRHPALQRLGVAVAEERPVDHRPGPQDRVGPEPPEEPGDHAQQQHHHDERHRPADADRPHDPEHVAPGHRVGEHRNEADERAALRERPVRRWQLDAQHPAGDVSLSVGDHPDQRDGSGHEEDADPDHDEQPADQEEHQAEHQRDHPQHLLDGVARQQEGAGLVTEPLEDGRLGPGGLCHRSILPERVGPDSGASTTTGWVLGPLTAGFAARRLEP